MSITVRQVLDSPAVQTGIPRLLTGADQLDRPVRWVHVFEGDDPAALLSGGELLLTTLVALPDDPARQREYIRGLATAGAAALVVELGRRFASVPQVMVDEASAAALPVVALHRTVKFVTITEAVHARIVDDQHELLTFTRQVHEVFTQVAVAGADAQEIIERTAQMAGTAVVLENLAHEVIAYTRADAQVLTDWSARSRLVDRVGGTHEVPEHGWLVTGVGGTQGDWGRLVLVGKPVVPPSAARMLVERAAQALAVARLMERDAASLRSRALQRFLAGFADTGARAPDEDVRAAAEAFGLVRAQRYLALCVARGRADDGGAGAGAGAAGAGVAGAGAASGRRDGADSPGADALSDRGADPLSDHRADPLAGPRSEQALAEAVSRAIAQAQLSALVSPLDEDLVGVLVALPARTSPEAALETFAAALGRTAVTPGGVRQGAVVGATPERHSISQAGADLTEAGYIARAAALIPAEHRKAYHRIADIGIRGLLMLLGGDERLTAFAERQLAPLLIHDDQHGTGLVTVLRRYLEAGGAIAPLARALHLSRQALYARLRRIERILGVDLADAETRTALHVALLAKEVGSAT
ncbi:PucR family transcriptional regulator [Pseudactinotalea sp. Z1739]|uniref:PucR family transcriptional regulator n=1 Tax=Pseudactinotalea sp. Z1739 TaxID=3413028 RepID=UPI003C7C0B3D